MKKGQNDSSFETAIEGIRLVDRRNGTIGGSQGRVEVLHDGLWGTICSHHWDYKDAKVACRMLGFEDAICELSYHESAYLTSPIWMDDIFCSGSENYLDQCHFGGWGRHNCHHAFDAGLVCSENPRSLVVGTPYNVTLIASSTATLTIGWQTPLVAAGMTLERYTIRYETLGDTTGAVHYKTYDIPYYDERPFKYGTFMSRTVQDYLTKATNYSVQIQLHYRHPQCGWNNYVKSNFSDPIYAQTNEARTQSNISVRLVPAQPGIDFIGRVEVLHNDEWGTVCDDGFHGNEADVICRMLNFTEGAMCTAPGGYGRNAPGQDDQSIWLDDVHCSRGVEILEDCGFNDWGVHSCTHAEDVSVYCRPGDQIHHLLPPVENLTVISVGSLSVTVGWNSYNFSADVQFQSKGFQVLATNRRMEAEDTYVENVYDSQSTAFTVNNLPHFNEEYNISVRAFVTFPFCYSDYLYSRKSTVIATTVETAPTSSPEQLHVVGVNSSAIETRWGHPIHTGRGGIVRGYKIFVQPASGGEERVIDTQSNTTIYLVGGLQQSVSYRISVLAYTSVGDGPRSLSLNTTTLDHDPLIIQFGVYGDGLDQHTAYTWRLYDNGENIFCGTGDSLHVSADWYYTDGTRIGDSRRYLRVTYFPNGTAVLKIAENRRVHYCDGGTFTCIARSANCTESRNFTLIINDGPQESTRPFLIRAQSTSVTFGWIAECDGGHGRGGFQIFVFSLSVFTFNVIHVDDPNVRNYTITGLRPSQGLVIRVIVVGLDGTQSYTSERGEVWTLPPAPGPPLNVSATLVGTLLVEVQWRRPAISNGNISNYIVYAIPLSPQGEEPAEQTKEIFPGTANAGNITLVENATSYHFHVSAGVLVGETLNEGELSALNPGAVIYIPETVTESDVTQATTGTVTTQTPSTNQVSEPHAISSGTQAGIAVGTIVGLGIVVVIAVVIVMVLIIWKYKPSFITSCTFGSKRKLVEEDIVMFEPPFMDDESKGDTNFDGVADITGAP